MKIIILLSILFIYLNIVKSVDPPPTHSLMTLTQYNAITIKENGVWTRTQFNVTVRNNMNIFSVLDVNIECMDDSLHLRYPSDIKDVELVSPNVYHLPKYLREQGGLKPQSSFSFLYINEGHNPAHFGLSNIVFNESDK
ncbi:cellulose-binding domain-containing protein [Heterostelium album PN500]|uniref:Cellulose-binding domain-containing protein n=1 Tax=Heterostelium pallidum (strain ATCC 26659 / Pp 5 / PN500) TaxID=670386 RepID=D3BGX0_HETP5|nr:cellulose-binding domain-containing protein [Heterostelium album PN500]EFA79354.1 cellulose-binding domain-containing protein [Heterostelium album PN500]|eukprot:XP_020431475.1 cellulose-binding domain-containing protein [Heterostelium album PN500]